LDQNKLGQILVELRDDIFLELKSLTTIVFSLTPSKEYKQEEKKEQKEIDDQIIKEYTPQPNDTDKEHFTFFNGVKSIYHVNYITNFIISDVTYNSVQQFRQHRKAQLFDDDVRATQILNATNPDEQRGIGLKVTYFNQDTWNNKSNLLMHEGNFHKFMQNNELKQELLAKTGTTLVQACPFKGDWSTGYFVDNPNCHNRQKWIGKNKLGEILTNLRGEILYIANKTIINSTEINAMATTFESEIDFGKQQRACPELRYYFNYIEKKIRLIDPKWDRRVLNTYRDYYIRDSILWHKSNPQGRTRSIQEYIRQKAVPIALRQEFIHAAHDVNLTHAGTDRCVMHLGRLYYWPSLSKDVKRYVKTCTDWQEGKSYDCYKALLKPLAIPNKF